MESYKVSNDPNFADKLAAVAGRSLDPPQNALVLCVDEKSRIQALDRTQPGLPLKKGRGQTTTHDYKRNGTTTLFAALNTADGEVMHICREGHRHQEWLNFLRHIKRANPAPLQIPLIVVVSGGWLPVEQQCGKNQADHEGCRFWYGFFNQNAADRAEAEVGLDHMISLYSEQWR